MLTLRPSTEKLGLTDEQRATRATGIGSSEIGALIGIDPFKDEIDVFTEKVHPLPEPEEPSEWQEWGHIMEPAIGQVYCNRTGATIMRPDPGTLRHKVHSFAVSSPDFIRIRESIGERIVEIKNVGTHNREAWGDPGTDDVPEHILVQCQWHMGVWGAPLTDLVPLIGGSDFRIYTIAFEPSLFEGLLTVAERFMVDHVAKGVPPPLSGSESSGRYLARRFPLNNGTMLPRNPDAEALLQALKLRREMKKAMEDGEELLKNQLKAMIGDADGIDEIATWKKKASNGIDWKGLAEHLDPPASLITKFTRPGSRVFLPKIPRSGKE